MGVMSARYGHYTEIAQLTDPLKSEGGGEGGGGTENEDDVAEPAKNPKSKIGELYVLGRHRLLCGDSTLRTDVERLMAGERAVLMNTDPPYGVSYTKTALSQ